MGTPVYLKAENLLPSAAYKFRGATNKIKTLIETSGTEVRIITASSGNHGMACALAASRLGIPATVVVPVPTPQIKKDYIRSLGANLLEIGETYDDSFLAACELAETEKMFYVHPVSDRYTVAGQGTITLELLEQIPDLDQVIVPIGGGGLITGISFRRFRSILCLQAGREPVDTGTLRLHGRCMRTKDRGAVPLSLY